MQPFIIDEDLVRQMLAAQFPQWAELPIRSISPNGWDNRSFRLGEHIVVRLPSAPEYSLQVEKEHLWLPRLAPLLPLQIPAPLAMGAPASEYPSRWSIYGWIEGETAAPERIDDIEEFANGLAAFLAALHHIDPADGPGPGAHNFHRGGSLTVYDAETRRALALLEDKIDTEAASELWEAALGTKWASSPVWIHGDLAPGNLLVQAGRLSAVIDFGQIGVGDPACDLSIAWTFFQGQSRRIFRESLRLESETWLRGRAWTLWKALIVAANLTQTNAIEMTRPFGIIQSVLEEGVTP